MPVYILTEVSSQLYISLSTPVKNTPKKKKKGEREKKRDLR